MKGLQGFDNPWQGEPSGIETHLSIGQLPNRIYITTERAVTNNVRQSFRSRGSESKPMDYSFSCYHFTSAIYRVSDFSILIVVQDGWHHNDNLLAHHWQHQSDRGPTPCPHPAPMSSETLRHTPVHPYHNLSDQ